MGDRPMRGVSAGDIVKMTITDSSTPADAPNPCGPPWQAFPPFGKIRYARVTVNGQTLAQLGGALAMRRRLVDDLVMRSYLAVAPVWVAAVLQGLLFGVIEIVGFTVEHHEFNTRLVIIGGVSGAMYGVAMGLVARRQRRGTEQVFGDLPTAQRRAVFSAAITGTPPEDPAVRAASVAILYDWLDRHSRTSTLVIVVSIVLAVASLVFTATDSWWYLAATVGFVAMIVWTLRYPVVLRRRVAAFEAAGPIPSSARR
jgi:hypothetical protein